MLAFSLSKLLLLLLIGAAVWFGFRYVNRADAVRRSLREELARRQQPEKASRVEAEDLVSCRACGAYVAARGATHCGRADCPWGRTR
jgi:hypothetical protein